MDLYDLERNPFFLKNTRYAILEPKDGSILLGYKFHFNGRFTRKQRAASY
jgi:hypothetical protein